MKASLSFSFLYFYLYVRIHLVWTAGNYNPSGYDHVYSYSGKSNDNRKSRKYYTPVECVGSASTESEQWTHQGSANVKFYIDDSNSDATRTNSVGTNKNEECIYMCTVDAPCFRNCSCQSGSKFNTNTFIQKENGGGTTNPGTKFSSNAEEYSHYYDTAMCGGSERESALYDNKHAEECVYANLPFIGANKNSYAECDHSSGGHNKFPRPDSLYAQVPIEEPCHSPNKDAAPDSSFSGSVYVERKDVVFNIYDAVCQSHEEHSECQSSNSKACAIKGSSCKLCQSLKPLESSSRQEQKGFQKKIGNTDSDNKKGKYLMEKISGSSESSSDKDDYDMYDCESKVSDTNSEKSEDEADRNMLCLRHIDNLKKKACCKKCMSCMSKFASSCPLFAFCHTLQMSKGNMLVIAAIVLLILFHSYLFYIILNSMVNQS